jgi:hypothetical protein
MVGGKRVMKSFTIRTFHQTNNYNGQIEMMRGAENVVRTGEMRNVYKILVWKQLGLLYYYM